MKTVKLISTLFLTATIWMACQPADKNVEIETETQIDSSELQNLKVKLNATEAQLLNIQVELAKCKGDSLAIDSLTKYVGKNK